jgi:tetratricopeptide (TPR) repeat protein
MFGRRSGTAFVQVAHEYARYRQAFDYFSDRGDAERAARFVTALRDYWWARHLFTEGEEWIARVLKLPDLPLPIHATLQDHAGALAFAQADYARARTYFEASVQLRRNCGSNYALAVALNHLAAASRWGSAENVSAAALYTESLAIARDTDDQLLVAAALMPLGCLALERGDLEEAERYLQQGLAIYVDLKLAISYPLALEQFAALAAAHRQPARALRLASAGAAWRAHLDTYQTPYVAWIERYMSRAREALSAAAAEHAWVEGHAMTLDQALDYAMSQHADDRSAF